MNRDRFGPRRLIALLALPLAFTLHASRAWSQISCTQTATDHGTLTTCTGTLCSGSPYAMRVPSI